MRIRVCFLIAIAVLFGLRFKAQAALPSPITLAWSPSPNAAGYTLYWGSQSGIYTQNQTCPGSQTTLTIAVFTNQVYYFAVTATDGNNNQSPLSAEMVYAPPVVPGVPSGLAVTGPPSGGPTASASWNASANALGYELYWGTTVGQYTLSNSCGQAQTSLNVTGLLTNQTYYFAVTALGSNGAQSALSGPVVYANALAANQPPPKAVALPAPGNFTEVAATNNGVVALTLSWNAVASAVGYSLNWGTNSGIYAWSSNCPVSETSVTLTNLIGGDTYYFAVMALSEGGATNSLYSPELIYTNTMGAPTNFAVASVSGGVLASWNPVATAASYTVFYGSQSGVYLTGNSAPGGQSNLSMINLVAGNVYYFAAAAIATNGTQSAYSAEVVFTNGAANGSGPGSGSNGGPGTGTGNSGNGQTTTTTQGSLSPLETRVAPGSVPNTAIVTWGAQPGVSTYVLYQWTGTLADYQNNNSTSTVATQPSMLVSGLATNQSYVFMVYAVDATAWGTPVAYINTTNAVNAPQSFAVAPSAGGVTASWSPVDGAANYTLFFGTQSGVYSMSINCPSAQTNQSVTNLIGGNTYYFAVAAFATNGAESPNSAEAIFADTNAPPVSLAPLAATVTPGSALNTAMVNWGAESGVGTYVLFQWQGTLDNYQNNNSISTVATTTNMLVTGLITNQSYVFAVYAVDVTSWGPPVAYLNPAPAPPPVPPVPSGVAVSSGAATNSAVVRWAPVPAAGGFDLYWGTNSGNYTSSNSLTRSQTAMTVSELATNRTYYFAVASLGTNGTESALSSEASYFNAAPITPAFAASTNQVPGIPPMLAMTFPNQQPSLIISGTVGALMKIQSTTNLSDPLSWATIDTVTLTNAVTNLNTGSSNGLPEIVSAAFAPAAQLYVPAVTAGVPAQAYRVCMPYDYPTLAYQVLPLTNYPTRLIGVYMPGFNNNVCYVTNQYNYIYFDPKTLNVDVQGSDPSIRQIATSFAGVLKQNWTSAVELMYTNGVYQSLATVVETDPASSDQSAGQQAPSSIQINF